MASFEQGFYQKLASSQPIAALVGTSPIRIQWLRRPQAAALPAITLSVVSGAAECSDEGSSGLARRRVQVDCWGDNFGDTSALADAVTRELSVAWSAGGFTYRGVFPENTIDTTDEEQGGTPIIRRILDYTVWYLEQEL